MVRQIRLNVWEPLVNYNFVNNTLRPETDQELFTLQAVFMSTVLDKKLLNPMDFD